MSTPKNTYEGISAVALFLCRARAGAHARRKSQKVKNCLKKLHRIHIWCNFAPKMGVFYYPNQSEKSRFSPSPQYLGFVQDAFPPPTSICLGGYGGAAPIYQRFISLLCCALKKHLYK